MTDCDATPRKKLDDITNLTVHSSLLRPIHKEYLGKICKVLQCEITDIMEFIDDEAEQGNERK